MGTACVIPGRAPCPPRSPASPPHPADFGRGEQFHVCFEPCQQRPRNTLPAVFSSEEGGSSRVGWRLLYFPDGKRQAFPRAPPPPRPLPPFFSTYFCWFGFFFSPLSPERSGIPERGALPGCEPSGLFLQKEGKAGPFFFFFLFFFFFFGGGTATCHLQRPLRRPALPWHSHALGTVALGSPPVQGRSRRVAGLLRATLFWGDFRPFWSRPACFNRFSLFCSARSDETSRVCPPLPSRNPGAPAPDPPPPARAGVTGATWSREYRLSPSHTSSPPKFPSFLTSCDSTSSIALLLGRGGGGGVGETQKKKKKQKNNIYCQTVSESGRKRKRAGTGERLAIAGKWLRRGLDSPGTLKSPSPGGGSLEKPRPLPAPQQHPSPGGVALVGIAPREAFLG
ncbi:gametocyte-specific factor 1 isoform X2 [Larus michahellis]|uniref:gametocyte-specific factor 1 isoform X2 n=1 Tax=Larus michahellis TaxID=119627 RepID=UPI003D9BD522